ncbi:hypothetical protein SAMN02927923_03304 [Microvirga guangxiensis]|uniref:Uncharacterized protein n=1 Tax=Microvirga guangxiensis TaxID=549386 RepID=A0A1G5KH04_9HYPH|nr:hypothetical protein SAMN02927923_03304 [Microvirga guangxiensis]
MLPEFMQQAGEISQQLSIAARRHTRLLLAHHVDQLDPTEDHTGRGRGLEPNHGSDPALDGAMILLATMIEVGTLPDANRLQITLCSILEPVCGITQQDRFAVRLAAGDHDPLRPAMPLESLAQEPLGGRQVAPLIEPKLNRAAMAVDRAAQIHPATSHLDVCLVDMPLAGRGSLAGIEALPKFGRVPDNPSVDRGVIDEDAALVQHLPSCGG